MQGAGRGLILGQALVDFSQFSSSVEFHSTLHLFRSNVKRNTQNASTYTCPVPGKLLWLCYAHRLWPATAPRLRHGYLWLQLLEGLQLGS